MLLVGCKKDLRNDPGTIEELRRNSQRPVAFEEVNLQEKEKGTDTDYCF